MESNTMQRHSLKINNKFLFIFAFFAVFSLMPAVSFGACYSNTGTLVPSRTDGSCYPGTSPTKPDNIYTQTNPPETNPAKVTECPNGEFPINGVCPSFGNTNIGNINNGGSGGTRIEGPGGTAKSSGRTQTISLPNPLKATSFAELINRLTNWLLVIGAPILVLMIIIGAFQIMTGAGNPENITKGRHTITYAIIGYALLLLSSGITLIIEQLLGVRK